MADGEQEHVKNHESQNTYVEKVKARVCEDSSSDIQNVMHPTLIKDSNLANNTNSQS
jgi:hypothetical protein